MKKQINPTIKAHLLPTLFILLSLLAIAVIPFAQAQRSATKQIAAKKLAASKAAATKLSGLRGHDARPVVTMRASSIGAPPAPAAPQVVLYDQYNSASTTATLSATFTDFPTYSSDLADDFVVPSGSTWTVMSIDADGVYFNGAGPADSWNVYIYANNAGVPGAVVASTLNAPVSVSGTTYTVNFSPAAVLPAGTYWVEIQANMTFATEGEWGWTDRTAQCGLAAQWQDVGGGFGVCPTWMPKLATCVPTAGGPDQVYRLNGTTTGGTGMCNAGTPTPTPCSYAIAQIGGAIVPGTTDTGNHCDDCTTNIALPFPYTLYDQTYNSVNVDSNGTLQFVSTTSIFTNSCLPDTSRTYAIYPYWDDLYTVNAGFGIYTSTSGTAPNRIFNIEWRNQYFPGSGTANFEVRLYEGQLRFDVIYGQVDNGNTSATAGVEQNSSNFNQYFCNGAGGAATGGQSYTANCATPTPTPTPTPGCTPGAWSQATPYPITDVRYGFAQTATHFYVFGGVSNGTRVSDVNRMDVSTGMWQARAPMPFTSEAPTCALMPSTNFVYCAEGDTGSGFARYDIAADSWTTLAPIPGGNHYGSASGAFNGKVFVAGGTTGFTSAVQVYDVGTNTWSAGTAAPNDFLLAGYQQVGQYLYVVGGFEASGPNSAAMSSVLNRGRQSHHPRVPMANNTTTWRLDMSSAPGVWSVGPVFTQARADFGLAYDSCQNKLYALGGDTPGGGFFDSTNEVDELSVAGWPAGTWNLSPPNLIAPNRQANQAGFSNGGDIWSVGGIVGQTFQFLSEVQRRTVCCPSSGCSFHVLIVYADTAVPTQLQGEIQAEPGVTGVDLFDGQAGTPTLAQLQQYNIVVAYSNFPFADADTLGNNLADYVDGGGVAVQYGFSHYGPGQPYGVNGRWASGNYNPYNYSTNLQFNAFSLGTFNAGHPLMAGVTMLNSNFANIVTPAAGATEVAQDNLGDSLVAYRPVSGGHTTVGVTAYVGSDSTQSGDWGKVIVNAGRWLLNCSGPTLVSAVSRVNHGSCGTFDIPLPGIECRSTGGNYTIVATFSGNETVTSASVTCHNPGSGTGTTGAVGGSGTPVITIPLTGVSNAQALTVHITGTTSVDIPVRFLIGDTNGNGAVNAGDVSQTKGQSGQPVTAANFRNDVNANCAINAGDINIVKAASGTSVPASCP